MTDDEILAPTFPGGTGGWTVSATASLQTIIDDPLCPALLRQMLALVLPWQMRNITLVRRALASPRTAPQWVAGLLAMGATVTASADGRMDEFPLEAVLRDRPKGTVEMLRVPSSTPFVRWGEAHVSRTPADEPIVAAVAVVTVSNEIVQQARVAITGVWPEPTRLAESPGQFAGGSLTSSASARWPAW